MNDSLSGPDLSLANPLEHETTTASAHTAKGRSGSESELSPRRWHLHRWDYTYERTGYSLHNMGYREFRVCRKCGKEQLRVVKSGGLGDDDYGKWITT